MMLNYRAKNKYDQLFRLLFVCYSQLPEISAVWESWLYCLFFPGSLSIIRTYMYLKLIYTVNSMFINCNVSMMFNQVPAFFFLDLRRRTLNQLTLLSGWLRMRVLVQYDMLLKCSVNLVRLGDFSSFCSSTQFINSAASNRRNRFESKNETGLKSCNQFLYWKY